VTGRWSWGSGSVPRKPGETADDRLRESLSALRPATKDEYVLWFRGYRAMHGDANIEVVQESFPEGEFFITIRNGIIRFDCSIHLRIIVLPEHSIICQNDCSVRFSYTGYSVSEGERVPLYDDMEL
ncbi:MAG: hypothetical protein AAB632_03325, partial [Patescibacteria group bacterium]